MFVILLILIFIRPFISSLAFPYLNMAYSVLLFIFLLFWVFLKGWPLNKIQTLKYPIILFCLALIISTFCSINIFQSFKELSKYISGLLVFFIAINLDRVNKTKTIRAIALAGLIISALAIYQYFFGFRHLSEYIAKYGISDSFTLDYISRQRVFFPFVTPNTLAGYLAMIIPLTLTNKNRIAYIVPLCFALLLTKSLGALLSLFLALLIYSYLQGKIEKRRILIFCGLIIAIGLVFMARLAVPRQHLQPIFSTIMRLNYWRDTLKIIQSHPLTGVGIGNFNLSQSRYAHNSYLQIWAELGILGIVSIVWLIIAIFKSAIKNINLYPNKKLLISLITANAVFLINNLVDFSFFLPEVSLVWWVILGLSKSKYE